MFREYVNQLRVGRRLAVSLLTALFVVLLATSNAIAVPWDSQNFVTKWTVSGTNPKIVLPIYGEKLQYSCYLSTESTSATFTSPKNYYSGVLEIKEVTKNVTDKKLKSGQTYILEIKATNFRIRMSDNGSRAFLKDILCWGSKMNYISMFAAFKDCAELDEITAPDVPKGEFRNIQSMFQGCTKLSKIKSLDKWDVSKIENMSNVFSGCLAFTGDGISSWKPANCEKFQSMFSGCTKFNQNLAGWKNYTSKAKYFQGMFNDCIAFLGDGLDEWNVSNAKNFSQMFYGCRNLAFKPDNWDVSKAEFMSEMFYKCSALDNEKKVNFEKWADKVLKVKSFANMFAYCTAFTGEGLDKWMKLGNQTEDISNMFNGCSQFDQDMKEWRVDNVKNMSGLFNSCIKFRGRGLAEWANRVENVENMSFMFTYVPSLAEKLDDWKVGKVKKMRAMFSQANTKNTNFSKWDVSSCEDFASMFAVIVTPVVGIDGWDVRKGQDFTSMFKWSPYFTADLKDWKLLRARITREMFYGCASFQSDLKDWFVENVEDAAGMFQNCFLFDSDLSAWNFKKLLYMQSMFENAKKFRGVGLEKWNVRQVVDMSHAFRSVKYQSDTPVGPDVSVFSADLSKWKVDNCQNFSGMFYGCSLFNSDLSKWDVGKAEDLSAMFFACSSFNSDLSAWNVEKVTNMDSIFMEASKFNSDISNWKTSQVQSLYNAFNNAKAFNYSLGKWNLASLSGEITLSNSGMGVANYDRSIKGWYANKETNPRNISVVATKLRYKESEDERNKLKAERQWKFTGDTKAPRLLLIAEPLKVRVKKDGEKFISYTVEGTTNEPTVKLIPEGFITYTKMSAEKKLKVRGVKPGLTHIRMQVDQDDERAYDDCDVLCYIAISDFEFAHPEYRLAIHDKLDLKKELAIKPQDATYPNAVKFTSKDLAKATVDEKTGVVTGIEEGEVEIEVESTDGDDASDAVKKTIKIIVHRVEVESITLLPEPGAWIGVGRKLELQVVFNPANTTDKEYELKLGTEDILKLEDNTVTGIKPGICVVTATTKKGNKSATSTIQVVKDYVPVANVVLDDHELRLPVRSKKTLTYRIAPGKASNKAVFWKSSDPEVASIDRDGVLTGLKEGKTTITVWSAENKNAGDVCEVEVFIREVTSITLLDKDKPIEVAQGAKASSLRYKIEPEDASDLDVEWTSSDENIIKVNKKTGELEGVAIGGPVQITVKALGSGSTDVEDVHEQVKCVRLVPTTGLSLPTSVTMFVGDRLESFVATFQPDDATDRQVTWTVEKQDIAAYDEVNSVLTALSVGETKLKVALVSDPSITAECTINVRAHIYATDIVLDPTTLTLGVDQEYILAMFVEPANASKVDVDWTVEDADGAISFDNTTHLVKGVKVGTATIHVALKSDPDKKASCVVTVVEAKTTTDVAFDVNPAEYEIEYGATLDLKTKLVFTPADATDRYLEWESASSDVVSVVNGVVKGLKVSTDGVVITMKLHSNPAITKTCRVKVKPPVVPLAIRLNTNEIKIRVDDIRTLFVKEFVPETATDRDVVWSTSDATKVQVDTEGKITAMAIGRAYITVALRSNPLVTDICMVEVLDKNTSALVTAIQIEDIAVTEGRTEALKITFEPQDATERRLYFEGIDADSFSIVDGKVRGIKPCEAVEVTAYLVSDPAVKTTFKVTIKPLVPVTSFAINHESILLYELNEAYLRVVTNPADADVSGVEWVSDDPTICTVQNGIVYGVAPGEANVIARLNGSSATCKVTVKAQTGKTGIEDDRLRAVLVYPNPFADVLRFKNADLQVVRYELLDGMGRIVRSANVTDAEVIVETRDLSAGFYLLRLYSESAVVTHKLVKR